MHLINVTLINLIQYLYLHRWSGSFPWWLMCKEKKMCASYDIIGDTLFISCLTITVISTDYMEHSGKQAR